MNDRDFLFLIVSNLVEYPDSVSVERSVDEMGVLLCVSVDKSDMGKIIGRGGEIARAIRTVIRAFGMKNNARVNVKILEPETN